MKNFSVLSLRFSIVFLLFILALSFACSEEEMVKELETSGKTTDPDAAYVGDNYVAVPLNPVNNSGVVGTATLTAMGNQTKVVIQLVPDRESGEVVHPVHIHTGICEDLNPKPEYPLNNIET